ncbi:hypothetical protein EW146_g4465 [Bondarzewia mesenterica]|uniref:Uncharacterized protein n=1 Tax=Bondarzewia mesenterica TaxID=1095465 RepID=A0A4V3XF46_9AGAM|nr:hypothetical protein EW146_g4465 [Bondarzewia mesenterica]
MIKHCFNKVTIRLAVADKAGSRLISDVVQNAVQLGLHSASIFIQATYIHPLFYLYLYELFRTSLQMAITRSFTVFRDEPSEPCTKPKKPCTDLLTTVSMGPANAVLPSVTTSEKENLHPVTGLRTTYNSDSQTKKRKNSALATKLLAPPVSKKQKETDEPESKPEAKKRKVSSTGAKAKLASSRKDGKVSVLNRKGAGILNKRRKVVELPKVEEEFEVRRVEKEAEGAQKTITQASIDSKCYDLTVTPLADVSKAYDPTASEESMSREDSPKATALKLDSVMEESSSARPKRRAVTLSPKSSSSKLAPIMTTPERRSIYVDFTFRTPSPSSKRFATSRAGGFDMFGDIEFKPT